MIARRHPGALNLFTLNLSLIRRLFERLIASGVYGAERFGPWRLPGNDT